MLTPTKPAPDTAAAAAIVSNKSERGLHLETLPMSRNS
jgi:hypothetical protein